MSWVKLDDHLFQNPKAVAAGKNGRALFFAGLCYAAQTLSDGFLAAPVLPQIAGWAEVPAKPTARRLEDVGLWLPGSEGWQINDYLKYNPSREKVLATREARAEAGRRGGEAKAVANGKQIASPVAKLNSAPFPLPLENSPHPLEPKQADPQAVDEEGFSWPKVWDHVAAFKLEARQAISPPLGAPERWRDKARKNAAVELRDQALTFKQSYDVTPYQLAELLVGRRSSSSVARAPRAVGS